MAGTAAKAGFSIIKLVVTLAIVGGVVSAAATVVVLRHHHLAQGYLYQTPATGALIYFSISESWYGGNVSGMFYTPYLASCQNGGQVKDASLTFDGTVDDSQVVLSEKAFGFTVFQAIFTRSGDDLLWTGTQVIGWKVPQTESLDFKPADDAGYNAAKQALAQAVCASQ